MAGPVPPPAHAYCPAVPTPLYCAHTFASIRPRAPLRTTAAIVAAGICAAPLAAQENPAQTGPERVHVVRAGDTLWEIARSCLDDPFLWAEIYRLNADRVRDPARIYPEQRLLLPECGAASAMTPGEAPRPRAEDPREVVATSEVAMTAVRPGDFYRAGMLLPDSEVPVVGRLVDRAAPTVIPLETTPMITLYDRVYVALDAPRPLRVGDPVQFYRRGREIKPYGRVYLSTGIATVEAVDGNVATVRVRTVYDAIAVGDLAVLPARFPVRPGSVPARPRQRLEARIVGFQSPHPLQATEDVAFLDVGRRSGVREGDEFEAVLPPSPRHWGTRPEIRVARVQVVRVTETTASARITALEHPALEPGVPVRRVAEMP